MGKYQLNLNQTHDPARLSWVESANAPGAEFPLQNLPYGVFSVGDGKRRIGVAIGSMIFDLAAAEEKNLIKPNRQEAVFNHPTLNAYMGLGSEIWSLTRAAIADLLDVKSRPRPELLVAQDDAELHLPIFVRSFTDFYASREHATNVGTMFRGAENALPPNWLHMPIGYNGRASTVVVSGTQIRRPCGQLKGADEKQPRFGPCERLDLELELGAIVGTPSQFGQRITTSEAFDMIFGYVLLNDWSARDIQVWEYQPLGPFQAKAFATSISPWVVTREALEPFRCDTPKRAMPLLPYLEESSPNNFDMHLEIALAPQGYSSQVISRTNYRNMYYSSAQQLAHHASSGCAMETGDLLGSGTVSGSDPKSLGSLLELSQNGRAPLALEDNISRTFIKDGDSVTLSGYCVGDYRVGFGSCAGKILPAVLD